MTRRAAPERQSLNCRCFSEFATRIAQWRAAYPQLAAESGYAAYDLTRVCALQLPVDRESSGIGQSATPGRSASQTDGEAVGFPPVTWCILL